ncbi:MAG TPA: glycogen debranching protein GlgX [Woeseiaceae bacterium]|nr:glycogen debranching protein GlgX [Woeseiaceae bacterium]
MERGQPAPLGASITADGVNFALHSSVAEAVELCLFDGDGREIRRLHLPGRTGDIWHGFSPGLGTGQRYGYRVWGPWQPDEGLLCNPAKLLLDPYARQVVGDFHWHEATRGRSRVDSARYVPKGVVRDAAPFPGPRPSIRWSEAVFYETHVRGYTMRHPAVSAADRGRFRGLCNAAVLEYLKALGITTVELMPVHAYVDEQHLVRRGLRNFWGYNPVAFFAPAPRFGGTDPVSEFREMVHTIHDAGLEVVLDVVYNHTGEGNHDGPTISFRGIDNRAYYRLDPADATRYVDDTGCGNTLNADSAAVQTIVLDSLVYWHRDMGVDGFRFDLATVLGRHAHGFSREHPLLRAIGSNPLLASARLVAEPWDPGPGGYQLGNFPPPFAELNDKFRDGARRFWRGDLKTSGELARRMHGSADLFEAAARPPHASVNKITSHDGFTLADVVAYNERHNEANGENNRDGNPHNFSRNYGVEGPTDRADLLALRRQQRLNMLATLLCAQGTPFLLAGDEFGNSQGGNNNAYAQDNDTGWLDWAQLDADPAFTESVRSLIALRREFPLLRLDRYVHGRETRDGTETAVCWINPDGGTRTDEDWDFGHAFGMLLEQRKADGAVTALAVLMNAWSGELRYELGPLAPGCRWMLRFASAPVDFDARTLTMTLPGHALAVMAGNRSPGG